jgi:hypothetical protein
MRQSSREEHIEYTIQTVDMLLGIIGGFAALVW